MSYLDDKITTEEFIKNRGAVKTQKIARSSLNLFDLFTKATFDGKEGEKVVLDIKKEIEKDGNHNRLFILTNKFIQWLLEPHADIKVKTNNHDVSIGKHTASSVKTIISHIRAYYEEFGQIEYPERKYRRMVKMPKIVSVEPYALTKEEIKQLCEVSTTHRKVLYMILKDTGLRIQEALLIKKDDFDFNSTPVSLNIPPNHDKTNSTNQTRYITSETREFLELYLKSSEVKEYLFIPRLEHLHQQEQNEERIFDIARKKIGFTKRYEHNNRHKIVIHSLRAFCGTVLAEKYGEEFAHGYIGHSKYLGQYIRNKKKYPEMFKRIENEFMLYKTVEVIDETEKIMGLQNDVMEMKQIMQQISQQKDISTKIQLEIQKLKK